MINKLFGAVLFVIVAGSLALAGSSTILYQSAGTIPFAITTDGSGSAYSRQTIWDYNAAANGTAVDAGHSLQVAGEGTAGTPAGGVVSVQGVSGGTGMVVSQPTAASLNETEANSAAILSAVQGPIPAGTNAIGSVTSVGSQYPTGATAETASATGTTSATTATLATGASVTTYICGFSIRANATGAATNNATVTGTVTGTLNFTQWTAPLASGLGVTEMVFQPCVPASAINTSIAVVSGAPGSGGVVSVTAWGYTK